VNSVPTLIINQRYVITGCHPVEVLEQALGQIIATGQQA
jgi:predicted DsbA family dithiol-disulfide isomerase